MQTHPDLICTPHRCLCEHHGGNAFPEGLIHPLSDKCSLDLPDSLRPAKRSGTTCCTMQGTLLAVILTQYCAEQILKQLKPSISSSAADDVRSDLQYLEERIREDILTYLDEEEGARPPVEIRIPTMPDGHWKHSWHLPRVPVRKTIEILNKFARWYGTVAERGFGVVHAWRELSRPPEPRKRQNARKPTA